MHTPYNEQHLNACNLEFRLPFDDRWFVGAAGDTVNVNHHMECESQWYGMDFVKVGGPNGNEICVDAGVKNEQYFCWNESVLSPIEGTVVVIENGLEDNSVGSTNETQPFGNHVVIQASPKLYVYLAHFKKDSIAVVEGQDVRSGQRLGACGNSGNSTCPHIHMHVQDQLDPSGGRGQRVVFSNMNVTLVGKAFESVDWPLITGLFVKHAPDA